MDQLRALARTLRIEAHAVWLTARHPDTPWLARMFGMIIAAYALSPIDLIPDFIPILGLLDDAVLIPLGIWLFLKMVPKDVHAQHKATAKAASQRPISRWGAAGISLIWLGAAAYIAMLLWRAHFS